VVCSFTTIIEFPGFDIPMPTNGVPPPVKLVADWLAIPGEDPVGLDEPVGLEEPVGLDEPVGADEPVDAVPELSVPVAPPLDAVPGAPVEPTLVELDPNALEVPEDPNALPLLDEDPNALPLLDEDPNALPLLDEDPNALPLLDEEPNALPLPEEDPYGLALLKEDPNALPLAVDPNADPEPEPAAPGEPDAPAPIPPEEAIPAAEPRPGASPVSGLPKNPFTVVLASPTLMSRQSAFPVIGSGYRCRRNRTLFVFSSCSRVDGY
jgi:hypothetical protein